MKKIFYLFVALTTIAFNSCSEKNAASAEGSSPLIGTWIEVTDNDEVVTNLAFNDSFTASYRTAYVYKFTANQWITITNYSGELVGDDFNFIEHTDVTKGSKLTVDYYIKDGKIYTSVVTMGAPITFINDKYVLLNNRTRIRKVNLVRQ